jgi:regulator of replication initiation timing
LKQIDDRFGKLEASVVAEQTQLAELKKRKQDVLAENQTTGDEIDSLRKDLDEVKRVDGEHTLELNTLKRELTQCQRDIARLQKELGTDVSSVRRLIDCVGIGD